MLKKFFFIVFVSLLVAGQALAQQASYLTNSTVTMETDGTNPDGTVNLQTNNAGRINFFTNRTLRGYIDGTTGGWSGFTLTDPTISGNLTFSTATAKIIPGATSLTFRNNADSADNIAIVDAGTVTFRNTIQGAASPFLINRSVNTGRVAINGGSSESQAAGALIQVNGASASTGNLFAGSSTQAGSSTTLDGGSSTSSVIISKAGSTLWTFGGSAGALTQDPANGGNLLIQKSGTGLVVANTTSIGIQTGQQLRLYNGGSGAIKPNNIQLEIETASNGGLNISNASASTSGMYFSNPSASYDGGIEYENTSRGMLIRTAGATKFSIDSAGQFIGTGTATLGWTVQAAVAATCTATCVTPCVFGQDTATKALQSCGTSITGSCLCAGAS